MNFERFVSLGNYALTKCQINRYVAYKFLGLSENSTLLANDYVKKLPEADFNAINGGDHFFDWVMIEDYDKLIDLLNGGLNYQLTPENLEVRKNAQGDIINIACQQTGIIWHHLFSRESGCVIDSWLDEVKVLAEEINHLKNKFLALTEYKTLYIVTLSPKQLLDGIAVRLSASLAKLRKNDNFALLVAVPDQTFELLDDTFSIYYRHFDTTPDFPQYPWLGNAASWDNLFSTFELVHQKENSINGVIQDQAKSSALTNNDALIDIGFRRYLKWFPRFGQ